MSAVISQRRTQDPTTGKSITVIQYAGKPTAQQLRDNPFAEWGSENNGASEIHLAYGCENDKVSNRASARAQISAIIGGLLTFGVPGVCMLGSFPFGAWLFLALAFVCLALLFEALITK